MTKKSTAKELLKYSGKWQGDMPEQEKAITTTKTIQVSILGKPRVKKRPRTVSKNGRTWTYTPQMSIDAEQIIKHAVLAKTKKPFTGDVKMYVDFYIKNVDSAKRGDIDNLIKTVLDALNGAAYVDDKQVKGLFVEIHQDNDERTVIEIKEIG